jgi:hypothetical protein
MRHNGRPAIKASTMRPENLNLREGEPRMVVCPDCNTWRRLTRSMIHPHRGGVDQPRPEDRRYRDDVSVARPSNGRRCDGSGQRIDIDLTPEQWSQRLLAAESTASSRRTTRPVRKPRPQSAPATGQMTPATRSLRELLAEHLQDDCAQCRSGHCVTVQLRTALQQHRTTCPPCEANNPCETGRQLGARISGIAHDRMRSTRPDLFRTTRQVKTVQLTRDGFVVRPAANGKRRQDV